MLDRPARMTAVTVNQRGEAMAPNASTYLRVSGSVREARGDGRPVVALESTVIAHGLPYPTNVEVARAMEATIRAEGATPATIALLDGQIAVGLEESEMERIATEPGVRSEERRVGKECRAVWWAYRGTTRIMLNEQ